MAAGRLVRVRKYGGDKNAVAYIVALVEKNAAVDLIRQKVAEPGDEVEDVGGVSDELLQALYLAPGHYMRADGAGHIPQQQQRPQASDFDEPE